MNEKSKLKEKPLSIRNQKKIVTESLKSVRMLGTTSTDYCEKICDKYNEMAL